MRDSRTLSVGHWKAALALSITMSCKHWPWSWKPTVIPDPAVRWWGQAVPHSGQIWEWAVPQQLLEEGLERGLVYKHHGEADNVLQVCWVL